MNEYSMPRFSTWVWLKHIHRELRQPTTGLDDAGYKIFVENTHELSDVVYNRPWGYCCGLFFW